MLAKPVLLKRAAMAVTMTACSPQEAPDVRYDVDILIGDDGRIAAMGANLLAPHGAEVVDVANCVALPGFVNAHEHLWQVLIRGLACDQDLLGWLPQMQACAERVDYAGARAAVALGASHMLNMGVTTVLDWSHARTPAFYQGNLDALEASQIRWQMAYAGPEPAPLPPPQAGAGRPTAAQLQYGAHPTASQAADLRGRALLAAEQKTALNVHFLEHAAQLADEPEALLACCVPAGTKVILNHAVHTEQRHLHALAHLDLFAVHCPSSNMRLASGIFDFELMQANVVPVGLGLDGGTNDSGDMFEAMRCAIGLQRATKMSAENALSPLEALRMATLGGAQVMGMQESIGALAVGKLADIVILDMLTLNAACARPSVASVVYTMTTANVKHVLVGGEFQKRDHRLVGVDVGQQIKEALRFAATMTTPLELPLEGAGCYFDELQIVAN